MQGFLVPKYHHAIRAAAVSEDYEFDDATVDRINKLFGRYLSDEHFDKESRKEAGVNARKQINKMAETLDEFIKQWENTWHNNYLLNHLLVAYCGRYTYRDGNLYRDGQAVDRDDYFDCYIRMTRLTDVQRLRDAINAVEALPSLEVETLPSYTKGRPNEEHLHCLVRGLYAIALEHIDSEAFPEAPHEIVGELLKIIDINLSPKTLRNIILASRK